MTKMGKAWPNIEEGRVFGVTEEKGAVPADWLVRLDLLTPMTEGAHRRFRKLLGELHAKAGAWLIYWRTRLDVSDEAAMIISVLGKRNGAAEDLEVEYSDRPEEIPPTRVEYMFDHGKQYESGGGRFVARLVAEIELDIDLRSLSHEELHQKLRETVEGHAVEERIVKAFLPEE